MFYLTFEKSAEIILSLILFLALSLTLCLRIKYSTNMLRCICKIIISKSSKTELQNQWDHRKSYEFLNTDKSKHRCKTNIRRDYTDIPWKKLFIGINH